VIRLRENIALGQRVAAFEIFAQQGGEWRAVGGASSIGNCRLIRLDESATTTKVRLRITSSPVCPALSEFGLFE
jgi:alpha-L-fucosidase